jgi:hypothetical protein
MEISVSLHPLHGKDVPGSKFPLKNVRGLEVPPNLKNLPAGHRRDIYKTDWTENHSTSNHHTAQSLCVRYDLAYQGKKCGFRRTQDGGTVHYRISSHTWLHFRLLAPIPVTQVGNQRNTRFGE